MPQPWQPSSWRLTVKGRGTTADIQRGVGQAGGLITRIRLEADQTHLYFSAEKPAADDIAAALEAISAPTAVDPADVAQLDRRP